MSDFDIIIGIPSFNEARNISHVLKQVDEGLVSYFTHLRSIVVNMDNHSWDGTARVFLDFDTRVPKIVLSTGPNIVGKGLNLRNYFRAAVGFNVTAGAIFDGDLESISPEWIREILYPVLNTGYDFVFPVYARHRYDGAISSLVCYPLLAGTFGIMMRQPIGGEFAFSNRFLNVLADIQLSTATSGFGIDIFITTEAIMRGLRICGVRLGQKIHRKRDRAKLGGMVSDVVASLFDQLSRSGFYRQMSVSIQVPDTYGLQRAEACPPVPVNLDSLDSLYLQGIGEFVTFYKEVLSSSAVRIIEKDFKRQQCSRIEPDIWCDITYSLLAYYIASETNREVIVKSFVPLFFGRLQSFVRETASIDEEEVEEAIRAQAKLFLERRDWLLSLISAKRRQVQVGR